MADGRPLRGAAALLSFLAVASCSSVPSTNEGGGNSLGPATSLSATAEPQSAAAREGLSTALARAGNTATSSGDYAQAVKMYARAHRLAPNRVEPALGLARAASAIKDHKTAAQAYRDALKVEPKNADALSGLGRELMSLQEPRKAIPYFEKALQQRREAWVHNELGVAYEMVGDFPSALSEYQAGLEIAPRDLTLRTNLGRALAWSGDYDAAVEILRVVATDPNATKKHRQVLSLVEALAGNLQAATEITRVDYSRAEVDQKIAYYRLLGELARSDDRDAVAKVLADSALRSVGAFPGASNRPAAFAARDRALAETDAHNTRRSILDTETRHAVAPKASSESRTAAAESRASSVGPKVIKAAASSRTKKRAGGRRPRMQTEPPGAKGPFAYTVQLAAFRTPKRAEKGWRILVKLVPDILSPLQHMIRPPNPAFKWDRLHRLRTLAFVARGPAEQICSLMLSRGLECLVVQTKKVPDLKFESFGRIAELGKGPVKPIPVALQSAKHPAKHVMQAMKRPSPAKPAKRTAKAKQAVPPAAAPKPLASSKATPGAKGAAKAEAKTAASADAAKKAAGKTDAPRNIAGVKRSASELADTIPGTLKTEPRKLGVAASSSDVTYQVQIGAYRTGKGAEKGWRSVRKSLPDLLGSVDHTVLEPGGSGKSRSSLYRLRTVASKNRLAAVRLCANLRARGIDCLVVQSHGWDSADARGTPGNTGSNTGEKAEEGRRITEGWARSPL